MAVMSDQVAYRRCARCVMDTTDSDISFDDQGYCSNCSMAERLLANTPATESEGWERVERVAEQIRRSAGDVEYHCVVGLSGGVDSSYVAWLAAKLDLRVLAVHFDNGWNDEIAVGNIQGICDVLGFDLATYVINWEEFRDLQRAFLKASVIDVELVTDHAIFAAMLRLAREHRIKFVLSGTNVATESILPRGWAWPKQDLTNIKSIHRSYGERPLDTYPQCGLPLWTLGRYTAFGPTYVEFLNQVSFRKGEAIGILSDEVGWRDYGGKHYESVFTRFYQAHILPEKFGVDKRLPHLSSLIMNNELTRDEALVLIEQPLYSEARLRDDQAYVLKKLGFSEQEWAAIMAEQPRPHSEFRSAAPLLNRLDGLRGWLKQRSLRAGRHS